MPTRMPLRPRGARARHSRYETAQEQGSTLLPVLLLMFLFSAVALGMAAAVRVEIAVADRFLHSARALYAAEAGVAAVVAELRPMASWTPIFSAGVQSVRADGAFGGSKVVPSAGTVSICCGPQSAAGRLSTETAGSPVPARRAVRWQPFLWIAFDALAPGEPPSRLYLVVWVADDEEDGDGDPGIDSNQRVIVRAEAIDSNGLRRIAEAHVARRAPEQAGLDAGGGEEGPSSDEEGTEEDAEEGAEGGAVVVGAATAVGVRAWREVR